MADSHGNWLRHFTGWVLAGTLAGAVVGELVFLYQWEFNTRYTARIPFEIIPPRRSLDELADARLAMDPVDWELVLHRQEFLFDQDDFLRRVLAAPEFHPQRDGKAGETPWLAEHKKTQLTALRHDLRVEARPDAAAFAITMTTRDPAEAATLVDAAKRIYGDFINAHERALQAREINDLEQAVTHFQDRYALDSDALALWAKLHSMDVTNTLSELKRTNAQNLQMEFIKASSAVALARAQPPGARKSPDDKRVAEPPPAVRLAVENDPTLRALSEARNNAQQEQAVESAKDKPERGRLTELAARVEIISQQIRTERERKLTFLTDIQTQQRDLDLLSKEAMEANIEIQLHESTNMVRTLGVDNFEYQQRSEKLKQEGQTLAFLRRRYDLADAAQSWNPVRVQAMAEKALPPETASEPRWYWFVPVGAGAGLMLAVVVGLLFEFARHYQRRSIERELVEPELPEVPKDAAAQKDAGPEQPPADAPVGG